MESNYFWTDSEKEYLISSWGNVSIPSIAAHLGKTPLAVREKANRLKLPPFLQSGDRYVTKHYLLTAIGHTGGEGYCNISYIKNRGLPTHKIKRHNRCFDVIYIDEFWEWAKKNRSFLDFSKFEKHALGPEPEWVATKRSADYLKSLHCKKSPWTRGEDERLKHYLKQHKYSYKELSKMLQRSEGAIQRRICDLGIIERPVKADNHNKWSDDDWLKLGEFIKDGVDYETMSEYFGRSVKAIRGRVFDMYLTEKLDVVRSYIGDGEWGDGRPEIPLKYRRVMSIDDKVRVKVLLSELAGSLNAVAKQKSNVELDYIRYWQKDMCMNWDDIKGCIACESDCDSCVSFRRIPVQYCKRCGRDFYERKENIICAECRKARMRQAQKKYAIINSRVSRRQKCG